MPRPIWYCFLLSAAGAPFRSEATDRHASLNIFLPSPWLFCHYFCHLDFVITLFIHPSQVSSSSQRASHPSASTSLRYQGESSPSAIQPAQAQVLQLPLWWGLEAWLAKKEKGTSVAELCQQCNNAQIGFGSSRYHKIKTALVSTERPHEAASKNDSSSLSAQTSTLPCTKCSLWQPGPAVCTTAVCTNPAQV